MARKTQIEENTSKISHRREQEDNSYKADSKTGNWNSASTSWGDDAYMKQVGKEGIASQQKRMKNTADHEMATEGQKSVGKKRSKGKSISVKKAATRKAAKKR